MAFKLTYSDGQESDHDDDTVWELDNGVLKLGREEGQWSVLLSPSHWAVLELGAKRAKGDEEKDDDEEKDAKDKKDEKSQEESKDKDQRSDDDDADQKKKDD
jgi:hypothetical protein